MERSVAQLDQADWVGVDLSLQAAAVGRPPDDEAFRPLGVSEQAAWDVYFAAVASIQYHPANPSEKRLQLAELAAIADQMLYHRRQRCR